MLANNIARKFGLIALRCSVLIRCFWSLMKIWITKIWGMVPAGIQFLTFVCSRFAHGTLEIFLSLSNVKFLVFFGPLGVSLFDFLFRGLTVWLFQYKIPRGICTSISPRIFFGQYNVTRNLFWATPGLHLFPCVY